jgi:hypothetical protein
MKWTALRSDVAWHERVTVIALVVLFGAAAIDKLFHLNGFYFATRHYVLVPPIIAPYLTLIVPMLELWVAIGLAVPIWRPYAAVAGTGLLVAFAAGLTANYLAGISAPCGCMYSLTLSKATLPHVLFNGLAAALSATLVRGQDTQTV